jgi:hypothetical protein
MLNLDNAKLKKTVVHKIGNKVLEQKIDLSDNILNSEDHPDLSNVLARFFLSSFKDPILYTFTHPTKLDLNDVYTIVGSIFESPRKFLKSSQDLATILYDSTTHPKVKPGELYVASFAECMLDNQPTEAIGIFKTENDEVFLQVSLKQSTSSVNFFTGISTKKVDKGALILNTQKKDGYVVVIVDNLNALEAKYWKDDFLKLKVQQNDYKATADVLQITREFVEQLPDKHGIDRPDQIDLLNRSIEYFKSNDNFNKKEFERDVFQDKDIIKSFRSFDSDYRDSNSISDVDQFEISTQAVRKQARIFKSVLKLDKNFHVYIHGDRSRIEHGIEKDGRKYYKIYYDEER